jgi:hypothetical protein
MQEASFQMWMMKQPKAMQTVYNDILTRNLATGGKGLVDATKARLMGFAGAFSKEGQAFNALFGEANEQIEEQINMAGKKMTEDQRREALDKSQVKMIRSMIGNIDGMDTTIMALGQQMGLSGKGMEEFVTLTNKWRSKEGGFAKTEEEMMADLKQVWLDAKKNAAESEGALDREEKARAASVAIQNALNPLLIQLAGITTKLIGEFTKIITENMPQIKLALAMVVAWIEKVFKNPQAAINDIKGLFQDLLAAMLDLATNSWWGRRIFGSKEDVENLKDKASISKGRGVDKEAFDKLQKLVLAGGANVTPEQKQMYEMQAQTLREAAGALIRQTERGLAPEFNKDSAEAKAMAEREAIRNAGDSWERMNAPMRNAKILEQLNQLESKWSQNQMTEAANMKAGKYTLDDMIDAINRKDYMSIPKRAGGSPGGVPEDWGKESLVKLHGKEAILTEEQLAAMSNSGGGGSTNIELADLKIVAEGIITLNRQAALQNKILGQMADNQKTMLQRSSGNRLMV